MKVFVVDGEEYFAVPEVEPTSCIGCAFHADNSSCLPGPFVANAYNFSCSRGYIYRPNTPANREKWAPIIARARMKVEVSEDDNY